MVVLEPAEAKTSEGSSSDSEKKRLHAEEASCFSLEPDFCCFSPEAAVQPNLAFFPVRKMELERLYVPGGRYLDDLPLSLCVSLWLPPTLSCQRPLSIHQPQCIDLGRRRAFNQVRNSKRALCQAFEGRGQKHGPDGFSTPGADARVRSAAGH